MKRNDTDQIDWLKNLLGLAAIIILTIIYIEISNKELVTSITSLILQIIPNLIAALIAVLTVYYTFIRKGISSENKLKDIISEEVKKLLKDDAFDFQVEIDKEFNLKDKLENAKELLIVGYSCRYIIAGLKTELVQAIKNKMDLKVLAIQPESDTSKFMMQYRAFKELDFDIKHMKERLQTIEHEVTEQSGKKKVGKIELRTMNWIPSCSLIFYFPKNNESSVLKLKVYAINHETTLVKIKTHKLIYEFREKELFKYFLHQFNELWKMSSKEIIN